MHALAVLILAAAVSAAAQHHHPEPSPSPSPSAMPSPPAVPAGHSHHGAPAEAPTTAPATPSAPAPPAPARTLSQSDMSLMAGMTARDAMAGMPMPGWTTMTMGVVRLHYNRQGGPSGDTAWESTNWAMAMAQRDVAKGRVTLMGMFSLEPATFEAGGMPELFQTGETYRKRPLVDRQHPHDLFMNLSVTYRRALGARAAWWVQLAPVGEPALGPTAFMHRASIGENPAAPLSHHWHDSTHITNSVITVGGARGRIALEASTFHGEEPDEGRWDLDGGAPDSWSARTRVQLGGGWSGQLSYGFLKHPEALEKGDTRRTTASLHYGAEGDRPVAVSLVWGHNDEIHAVSDAFLAEGAWQLTRRDQVFGRVERVDKGPELLLNKGIGQSDSHGHSHGFTAVRSPTIPIAAFTLGYFRNADLRGTINAGLGGDVTVYQAPTALIATYGANPASVHVVLRARWGRPHAASHGGHAGH